jgi:hypothetical protein
VSGWDTLRSIIDEAREFRRWEAQNYPISCPNDGEPLITGPDGHKFCPFDGYRP